MAVHPSQSEPSCPRCGYDQSGACGTWRDECPLTGTCPECGLLFEWADAFNARRKRLPWLFEHKAAWSPGVIRAWRSWLLAVFPSMFWRRVTLAHANHWTVVLWPIVLLFSLGLLSGTVRMAYTLAKGTPPPVWLVPAAGGGWTPQTLSPWQTFLYRALEAWGMPWYPVTTARWSSGRGWTVMMETWAAPMAVVAGSAATGLTLMTLTTSRRICGVRAGHIVRAMTYRLAPLGFLYLAWCAARLLPFGPLPVSRSMYESLWVPMFAAITAWGVWWWRTTFVRGWLMPQAGPLSVLLGVVDVLAGLAAYAFLSPYTAGRMMV